MSRRRLVPTLAAAVLALAYVVVSPPSLDLAAHLLRAKLFRAEGFGLWDNWWYAGHHTLGYSVLFPPLAALLTPQLLGALSAVGTAAVFEALAHRRFGAPALAGATWFGLATAVDLYTGRLTFAFGLLFATGAALALQRRRDRLAALLAALTALASPVAALFAALVGAACAFDRWPQDRGRAAAGLATSLAALAPVLVLSVLFPEGGSEPFTLGVLWPVVLISVLTFAVLPRTDRALRAGVLLYLLGCLLSYAITSPVGSNSARLGPLVAGPLVALVWEERRRAALILAAVPLIYLQWQAPVRDVGTSWGDPSTTAAYYAPVTRFLAAQSGPPFRVEVAFTKFHWEAYEIAPQFPLARGWERQLDILDNGLFYRRGALTAQSYAAWLHRLGIRFVAVAAANADYSARAEIALIDRGLPYLREELTTPRWRVYAVADPTPLAAPPATVTALGPASLALRFARPGSTVVRVHFTPYWALIGAPGCVARAGELTRVTARRGGAVRLVIRFSLDRVDARSPRCN